MGDSARVFFIVCFCLLFVCYVTFLALNFRLRAFPPIRGRNLPMVCVCSLLALEGVVNTIFQLILGDRVDIPSDRPPVLFRAILAVICVYLLVVAFTLRTWALLLAFRIARRGQEHVRSTHMDPAVRAWFVRMRFLKSPRLHFVIFSLAALYICTTFAIVASLTVPTPLNQSGVWIPSTLIVLAIAVRLSCLMKPFSDDGYFIKAELNKCGWLGLVALGLGVCGAILDEFDPLAALVFQDLGLLVAYSSVVVWGLVLPYLRARQGIQATLILKDAGLSELMHDPVFRAGFREFLLSEFSAENMDFCDAVEALEALVNAPPTGRASPLVAASASGHGLIDTPASSATGKGMLARSGEGRVLLPEAASRAITRIVDLYVAQGATFEVNISSQESKQIRKHFEAGELLATFEALVAAKGTVLELMRRDSLPRFKASILRRREAGPAWQKDIPTMTDRDLSSAVTL